jgi:hypothetical protein
MKTKETTKSTLSSNFELLNKFYRDKVPAYIKGAGKARIVIHVGDEVFGYRDVKITIEDVVKYYAFEASDFRHDLRMIADYISDWRHVDRIAKECLEWFKFVNAVRLKRTAHKYGLMPKF